MKVNAVDRDINGRSTTMRWLREHAAEADQRQWDIMNHNAAAALKMVERVGTMEPERRMVRLGSEMLQGYTEPSWINWWQRREIQDQRASLGQGWSCKVSANLGQIVPRGSQSHNYRK